MTDIDARYLAAETLLEEARNAANTVESVHVVEMLAMAVELEAEDEDVHTWMCGEESLDFIAAAKRFVDAVWQRRAEKGDL